MVFKSQIISQEHRQNSKMPTIAGRRLMNTSLVQVITTSDAGVTWFEFHGLVVKHAIS